MVSTPPSSPLHSYLGGLWRVQWPLMDSSNSKEKHKGLEPPSTTSGSESHQETSHTRSLVFTSPGSVVPTAACILPVGRIVERKDKLCGSLHQKLKPLDATALFYALSCLSPTSAGPAVCSMGGVASARLDQRLGLHPLHTPRSSDGPP